MGKYILPAILGILLFLPEADAIIPDRNYIRLPQDAGLIYKKLDVTTEDGLRIETWFYPAQDFPEENSGQQDMLPYRTIDEEKRPALVICNGDAGNMSYQQIYLAMIYAACGFNVVTFDWRGFGASSEFEMDNDYLCYTEMLEDYRAVLAAVKEQKEVDGDRIFLMGWSTGAYLSMITAYNDENAAGCILCGVPSTFEEIIPVLVRNHPAGKTEAELIVPEDFPKEQMPALIAAAVDGRKNLRRPPGRHVQEALHIRKRRSRRDGRPVFHRHVTLCRRDGNVPPGGCRTDMTDSPTVYNMTKGWRRTSSEAARP